ncbi:MAG: M23 family metallopeptidase [Crocinitomicaceae bacterium]|jgi:hypothetical protein
MRYIFISLILVFISISAESQNVKVDPKYHSPLGIPLQLSAIFGDIRPNHFHMGLDFKTNQREGIPIHAINDGYISRIRIAPTGYGKVLYINHPNGITSVYAHCSSFSKEILDYLLPIQTKAFSNNIDIKLTNNDFPIKKGQLIALSGNSGSSTGPHLHFEIRDTETEHGLNPLLHGFSISDNFSPTINAIKLYAVDEKGYQIPGKSMNIKVQKTNGGYSIAGNKVVIPKDFIPNYGLLAFAVSGFDQIGTAGSNYGLFENICVINKDTLFHSKYDRISFDDSRYVNSHQDLEEYKKNKTRFHKLFRTAHNPLQIYQFEELGTFKIKPKDSLNVQVILKDVSKNYSKINFAVITPEGSPVKSEKFYSYKTHLVPDSSYRFIGQEMEIDLEPYTFYEPIKKFGDIQNNRFGAGEITIQKSFKVKMTPLKNVDGNKQYIQVISNGKFNALITTFNENKLNAESKLFGQYVVKVDTIAPKISPLNFKETDTIIGSNILSWKVSDGQTDINNYNLLIDGEWYPLDYDLKSNRLVFNRQTSLKKTHTIEVLVSDNCGNVRAWKKKIYFN